MSDTPLHLFLFTADLDTALRGERAGIDSVIVDWERQGKNNRQYGHDTEINDHSPEAVSTLARRLHIPVTVRVNPLHDGTHDEVQHALDRGASILMLPMATDPHDVERFVGIVDDRARTLIQIETQRLANQCAALQSIPWDYAHVGLNDLKISRGGRSLWEPLVDGTIERICHSLRGRKVGFGGATIIGGGSPIPFLRLFEEMARLKVGMALLRRSFLRESERRDWTEEIRALRAVWDGLRTRNTAAVQRDSEALQHLLKQHLPSSASSVRVRRQFPHSPEPSAGS